MMMRREWIVNPLIMRAQRTTGAGNSRTAVTQKEVMTMETSTWSEKRKKEVVDPCQKSFPVV